MDLFLFPAFDIITPIINNVLETIIMKGVEYV